MVRLDSNQDGVRFITPSMVPVRVLPQSLAVFRVVDQRRVITSTGTFGVQVERTSGFQLASSVTYSTAELSAQTITIGLLTFRSARALVDFTMISTTADFPVNEVRQSVDITISSVPPEPLAFQLTLETRYVAVIVEYQECMIHSIFHFSEFLIFCIAVIERWWRKVEIPQ